MDIDCPWFAENCTEVVLIADWSKVKRTIAERKMRSAANTNNSEQVEQLCAAGCVDVNSCDEHRRSALHFAAAKVVPYVPISINLSQ